MSEAPFPASSANAQCGLPLWHFRILHHRPPGYLHQWVFGYFGWKFMMSPTFLAKNDPVLGSCKPEFLVGCRPSNPDDCISLPQKRLCSYLTVTQCWLCLLLNNSSMGLTSFLFTYPFDRQSLNPGPPLVWWPVGRAGLCWRAAGSRGPVRRTEADWRLQHSYTSTLAPATQPPNVAQKNICECEKIFVTTQKLLAVKYPNNTLLTTTTNT